MIDIITLDKKASRLVKTEILLTDFSRYCRKINTVLYVTKETKTKHYLLQDKTCHQSPKYYEAAQKSDHLFRSSKRNDAIH